MIASTILFIWVIVLSIDVARNANKIKRLQRSHDDLVSIVAALDKTEPETCGHLSSLFGDRTCIKPAGHFGAHRFE